jgi:hypothetical protein
MDGREVERGRPIARGRWPVTLRHSAGLPRHATVIALTRDGMLMEGDVDLRSGDLIEVEFHQRHVTVPARVLRAPGAAFLRFSDEGHRDELLAGVGLTRDAFRRS